VLYFSLYKGVATNAEEINMERKIMTYQIESKDGTVYGTYAGDTPEEAFAAMLEDAGGSTETTDGTPAEGHADDWIITPTEA
jgi:hypothetical protein